MLLNYGTLEHDLNWLACKVWGLD